MIGNTKIKSVFIQTIIFIISVVSLGFNSKVNAESIKRNDNIYILSVKPTDKIIYVSTKGNDLNDGLCIENAKATIQSAIDKASQYIKLQNVIIDIEEGDYHIDSPLNITDKNTSGSQNYKLVLYGEGNVNVDGGIKLDNNWKYERNNIWSIQLDTRMTSVNCLFVNEEKKEQAKYIESENKNDLANNKVFFNKDGEYYYDKLTSKLYYYTSKNPNIDDFVISNVKEFMKIKRTNNSPIVSQANNLDVVNVTFKNSALESDNYNMPYGIEVLENNKVNYIDNYLGESMLENQTREMNSDSDSGAQNMFSVHINYNTTESYTKLVTISANREMQEIPGWKLSVDKKTMTKEYNENTTEEVVIKDTLGTQINATINVNGVGERVKLNVRYGTKLSDDKKSCVATITANKELQEVKDWNLSTDKKTLTRTYTENGDYEVLVKDVDGIEANITFNISEIGKKNFEITIQKVLSSDKKKCTVTIVSNKEIEKLSDWDISEDKKKLTKVFTENVTQDIILKDLDGNEKTISISINEVIKEENNNNAENIETGDINSTNYVIENNTIKNVQPNTKYEEFKKGIISEKEYEVIENGKSIEDSDIMKTGQKLVANNTKYTIIVDGDTNGDGFADIEDITNINNHRFNKIQLKEEFLIAADVNNDNKVDIEDIFNINKFRLGRITSLSEKIINKAYASISISGSKGEAKIGDTFEVAVSAKCDDGINGITSEFTFDENALDLVECKVIDKFIYLNEEVKNSLEVINKDNPITDSDIYTLTFKVKETAEVGKTTKVNIGRIAVNSDTAGETVGEGKPISITIKEGNSSNNQNNNNQNSNNQNNNNQNSNSQNSNNQNNNNQNNNNQNSNNQNSNNQNNNNQNSNSQNSNNQNSNNQNSNNQNNNNQNNNNQNNNNQNSNSSTIENSENRTTIADINNISKDKKENYGEPISSKKIDYENDITTARSKIPQTGVSSITLGAISILSILAVVFYKKMKKNEE